MGKGRREAYVAGISERIRSVCRDFNVRAVVKSGPTLHSVLTKVKDLGEQSKRRLQSVLHLRKGVHWRDYTPASLEHV